MAVTLALSTSSLDYRGAEQGAKIRYAVANDGREHVLKVLCCLIKLFDESVRSSVGKMRGSEIIEVASLIIDQYNAESLEDVALALKRAKLRGDKFYSGVDATRIFRVINDYLEEKALWREEEAYKRKKSFDLTDIPARGEDAQKRMSEAAEEILKSINTTARKRVSIQVPPVSHEQYFRSQLIERLPDMNEKELIELRKQYSAEGDRFLSELELIENEILARAEQRALQGRNKNA